MKKLLVSFLSVAMLFAVSITSFADNSTPPMDVQQDISNTVKQLAYSNYESASNEMKAKILEARNSLIYSTSWVANGASGRIVDETGNVIEVLPDFYELYPKDWEIPTVEIDNQTDYQFYPTVMQETSQIFPFFNNSLHLKKPPETTGTPAFCTVITHGFPDTDREYIIETIYTSGVHRYPGYPAEYNLGYTNADTGASYGYKVNLDNGQSFNLDPPLDVRVAVHASTHNNEGEWSMSVNGLAVFPQ